MKTSLPSRPQPPSFISALRKTLLPTIILIVLSLLLLVALFWPTFILIRFLPAATTNYSIKISNALIFLVTLLVQSLLYALLFHAYFLRPLYQATKQPTAGFSCKNNSYVQRYLNIYTLRTCQVLMALLRSGPLSLLSLAVGRGKRDPFRTIIDKLYAASRNMDATILGVRPPEYRLSSQGGGRHINIPLRDGEITSATLYSPLIQNSKGDKDDNKTSELFDNSPRPVVLVRTPYNRESLAPWGARFAERGYHFVAQDTRGRFGSTGDFFPMLHEAEDGAATIEWLAQQPWCNGRVGMSGVSYLGLASWAAMREQVPALKAVAPILAATDLHHVMFGSRHNSGAAHVELLFRWSYLVIHLMAKPYGMLEAMFTFFRGTGKALRDAYMHAPLDEVDTKFLCPNSEPLSWFHDAFAHPLGTEEFWDGKKKFVDFSTLDKEKVPPVLLLGGWYDFFCSEQLFDYQDLSRLSNECRLVVGPFTHWCVLAMQPKMFRSLFDFFDAHLLNDPCARKLPPVEVFEMGYEMGWRQFDSWPPSNISNQRYLLAVGEQNELLMEVAPKKEYGEVPRENEVEYVYDPADPTPQIGGGTFNPTNCGRMVQNKVEERDDVLVFTSKPLTEPTTIAGQIKVVLHVSSNVEGTDYVARACHVTPDGVSENIADGITRRFDLEPGVESRIEIVLSPTMNRFAAGDRIRLQICSAAFPKHGRHLNTSDSFHLAVNHKLSKQRIIMRGNKGSHVVVPLLAKKNETRKLF